ncbi:hypothetical protein [Alicyclobacillus contaminans]|uniref:hypothetical protein n=1 Tax=Alicyclobacillus contaminans TaxID=392016 RepID=UPI00040FC47C|nr:hypothetical protein [Alicyclobacillus contaminans]
MYNCWECQRFVGRWVQFRTQYGCHLGYVERVSEDSMIVVTPQRYMPAALLSAATADGQTSRMDVSLTWGIPRSGPRRAGVGPWGPNGGVPGYGFGPAPWYRWAVSFLIIYALWGLLW